MQLTEYDIRKITPITKSGVQGGIHSNRTFLLIANDGSKWVWKRHTGEEKKELFVYEFAKLYFREVVPEVQILCFQERATLGCGSAMRKVSGVAAKDIVNIHGYFYGNPDVLMDMAAMVVMDYLLGNPDRHAKNWYLMHNGRIAAIDNGWADRKKISIEDALKPAKFAKIDQDPDLWPQLIYDILYILKQIDHSGLRTAKTLARRIGLKVGLLEDWPERVEELREWAFAALREALSSETGQAPAHIHHG